MPSHDSTLTLLVGDCLDRLKDLPEKSVQTCITSPPYFELRDYGVECQIGLETTPEDFIEAMVAVFREVRPCPRRRRRRVVEPRGHLQGQKPARIPWRVALALSADGWHLRSDLIWAKASPMPGSQTDRPTSSHEYVFLLTKNPRYFYDNDSIKESTTGSTKCGRNRAVARGQTAKRVNTTDGARAGTAIVPVRRAVDPYAW